MCAASVSATLRRRSASASSITPASEDNRPPSNAAVTFLRETLGKLNVSWLSSVMAGVAAWRGAHRMVSTPIPYASSMPCPTPVSSTREPPEYDGLEAMQHGVPVVITKEVGTDENVRKARGGLGVAGR